MPKSLYLHTMPLRLRLIVGASDILLYHRYDNVCRRRGTAAVRHVHDFVTSGVSSLCEGTSIP